jgi:SagB-type dehydrogenase family enzyme
VPPRAEIRVRRVAHLVLYWRNDGLAVHNYATGTIAGATPEVCEVLDFCGTWRTLPQISTHLGIATGLGGDLVRRLVSRGLLQRADRKPDARTRAMSAIDEWNPAAGLFHSSSRQVRFLSAREADQLARSRAANRPMPPPVKRLRHVPVVSLPRPATGGEFPAVLRARRTWRRYGTRPVSLADMATSLALTAGVQQWIPTEFGRLPLKTSPSGGARHPIELYVCAQNVAGLRAGLYHYAADVHRLERLRLGDMTSRLRAWMPHSEYFAKAAFAVILTAVLDREVWRYPYSRAYRAALAEAGHVCQTFCLTATWLGLAPFCLMGLDDAAIEKELGIDGVSETVLYVAGAGTRPRGAVWAPRPTGTLPTKTNPYLRPG